MKLLYRKIDRG